MPGPAASSERGSVGPGPTLGRYRLVERIGEGGMGAKRVVSAWGIAVLHASLGDVDDAFQWLDVAIEERATGLILLRVHPRLDPIREDPRYIPLVRRVGLADPN